MKGSAFLLCLLCLANVYAQPPTAYKEQYRPQFHYSPPINWCNDPNGLVFSNGRYHLFHQYNPAGNNWGHMSWAHATSTDLLHWKQLPLAIWEENGIMIFSGSCVADKNNSSGFAVKKGQVPMVAIYTGHKENLNQSQHLAYSLDKGLSWKKYSGNPVLDLHKKDFRDPKVFWYAPKNYWVMAVVLPNEHIVQFYSSFNLKAWKHLSNFGPAGDTAAVWECPDLVKVPVAGNPSAKKWVLQISQNASMQYFVGEFDGIHFTSENPPGKILRPDEGPDYYAGISYNQLPPDHPPVIIGWVNNWNYANSIPTTPWKGAMSLPRTISVKKINDAWILLQQPVATVKQLRQPLLLEVKNKLTDAANLPLAQTTQCEIIMEFEPAANGSSGLLLAAGNQHAFEIGYDAGRQLLYIERGNTAQQSFNKSFQKRHRYETPVAIRGKTLRLHVFFDNSIVEVFANDGETVLTVQCFPDKQDNEIRVFSNEGKIRVTHLQVWPMKSVWQ